MPYGKYIYIILIGIAVFMIAGCHTQKISSTEEKPEVDDAGMRLISHLEQRGKRFQTVKFRKVEIDFLMNGVNEKVRGSIAIYRDSMIAVSIVPLLGYEILRVLCTRDSIIVINRRERNYSATSFDHYSKKYGIPVGFDVLQAILINEVFYYKDNLDDRIYERQLRTRNKNYLYVVEAFRDGQRITNQGIEIDKEGRKLENVFIMDYDRKMKMNLGYDDFSLNENILFPRKLKLDIVERDNSIKLEIFYGQIVFDESINLEFAAPTKYTKVDI